MATEKARFKKIVCLGMMAAGVATAATLTENVKLDADADWREQGTVTIADGVTLDLNGRTGAWSTTSAFTNGLNRVTFAEGATVTVDAHARPTWSGKVVDWGAGNAPTNVLFSVEAESRRMGRAILVCDDGIYAGGGTCIIFR